MGQPPSDRPRASGGRVAPPRPPRARPKRRLSKGLSPGSRSNRFFRASPAGASGLAQHQRVDRRRRRARVVARPAPGRAVAEPRRRARAPAALVAATSRSPPRRRAAAASASKRRRSAAPMPAAPGLRVRPRGSGAPPPARRPGRARSPGPVDEQRRRLGEQRGELGRRSRAAACRSKAQRVQRAPAPQASSSIAGSGSRGGIASAGRR